MLNFEYFKDIPELAPLHKLCDLCEQRQYIEPDSAAINARKALEWLVKAIYTLKCVEIPERAKLYDLIVSDTFTDFISDPQLMKAAHWIRKTGNLAAHDGNYGEFATIRNQAGLNSFKISVKEFVSRTNAISLQAKAGRLMKLNQIAIQQMSVLESGENDRKILK